MYKSIAAPMMHHSVFLRQFIDILPNISIIYNILWNQLSQSIEVQRHHVLSPSINTIYCIIYNINVESRFNCTTTIVTSSTTQNNEYTIFSWRGTNGINWHFSMSYKAFNLTLSISLPSLYKLHLRRWSAEVKEKDLFSFKIHFLNSVNYFLKLTKLFYLWQIFDVEIKIIYVKAIEKKFFIQKVSFANSIWLLNISGIEGTVNECLLWKMRSKESDLYFSNVYVSTCTFRGS